MSTLPLFTFIFGLAASILSILVYFKIHALTGQSPDNTEFRALDRTLEKLERTLRDELLRGREENANQARINRDENTASMKFMTDRLTNHLNDIALQQKNQLDSFASQLNTLIKSTETRLDSQRKTIDDRLKTLQDDNNTKLDAMRVTVDEKLQSTLEKRLGESFKLVSDRLEQVHKGLGEMQSLATGVGDLKKVLTNVKTRGIWGEMQLGALLEQVLTKDQYATNVAVKPGSAERVEFAIKLPGHQADAKVVWLPIDAKFPQDDYQRLLEAQDRADAAGCEEARKQLDIRIKSQAKDIRDKYVEAPHTTDFGILFLPVEGLYAEVLRRPGLSECLQRDYRIILAGPTTLSALLNSLQMGFRTLTIEKRSSEVWQLLGSVKTEFMKFGDILEKTSEKLHQASNQIDMATQRSRAIERRLRNMQDIPALAPAATVSRLPGAIAIPGDE